MDWNTLSQLSCAFLCLLLQLFVLLRNYRSKFSSAKKKPAPEMLPGVQPAVVPSLEQPKSVGLPSQSVCTVQLLGAPGGCAGPAVRGAIAVLRCQGGRPGCPHACVTLTALPKLAQGSLHLQLQFSCPFLHRCLNGWDRRIWRKNRLG